MSAADALPLPASPTIDEAYAFCRKIAHQYGANFSVGFRFLPKQKRRAVYAAYAFCRWADDIADESVGAGAPAGPTAGETPAATLGRLNDWQRELDRCYAGHPAHPITIALADALRFFQIPKSAFVALLDGCRQDLTKTRYQSFDELLQYCEMVAWSISDISLAIFGYRDGAAIEHGRKLATALQLTNVTRDIGDDLRRDRIYVPQDELRRFCATQLTASDDTRRLIEYQIDRAESYFREAEPLLDELSFDAHFPVLLMGGIYATVLGRLRLDPLAVLKERLSLSPLEKVRVVIARLLRPRFV
jgi:phytoene synthase